MKLSRVLCMMVCVLLAPLMGQAQGEAQIPHNTEKIELSTESEAYQIGLLFAVRSAKACQSQTPLPIWRRQ